MTHPDENEERARRMIEAVEDGPPTRRQSTRREAYVRPGRAPKRPGMPAPLKLGRRKREREAGQ